MMIESLSQLKKQLYLLMLNIYGQTIFFLGLPCSGKSTLVRCLGKRLNISFFCEEEENAWPDYVMERELSGSFPAAMWFRSMRVHYYHKAKSLAKQGQYVLVDSYFDKFFHYVLGQPGMEKLFPPDDDYFQELQIIAKKDFNELPLPDTLVFFYLEYKEWKELTALRSRKIEQGWFDSNFFKMQSYLLKGVKEIEKKRGCRVLVFKPSIHHLEESVNNLISLLNLNLQEGMNEAS